MDGDKHAADIAAVTRNCLGTVDDIFVSGDRTVLYREVWWISDPETAILVEKDGGKSWKRFGFFIPDFLHCSGCYHRHRQYCRRGDGIDCRWSRCRVLALDFGPHRHGHGLCGDQPGTEVPLSQAGWRVAVRSHGVHGAGPGLPEHGTDLCAVCGIGVSGDGMHGAGERGQ